VADRTRRTPKSPELEEAREKFLAALSEGYAVKYACIAAGVTRSRVYAWRDEDAGFRAAWDAALADGTETLEQEARRRAVEGTEEPIYQQGNLIGTVRKYSDTLLIFLLKGRKPDTYRDNVAVDHKGKVQHDHTGTVKFDPSKLPLETLIALRSAFVPTNGHANGVGG
jgi:hypothetical protein